MVEAKAKVKGNVRKAAVAKRTASTDGPAQSHRLKLIAAQSWLLGFMFLQSALTTLTRRCRIFAMP